MRERRGRPCRALGDRAPRRGGRAVPLCARLPRALRSGLAWLVARPSVLPRLSELRPLEPRDTGAGRRTSRIEKVRFPRRLSRKSRRRSRVSSIDNVTLHPVHRGRSTVGDRLRIWKKIATAPWRRGQYGDPGRHHEAERRFRSRDGRSRLSLSDKAEGLRDSLRAKGGRRDRRRDAVGAAKEVSAGAADHQCCRILTAVRQSQIGMAALLGLVQLDHLVGLHSDCRSARQFECPGDATALTRARFRTGGLGRRAGFRNVGRERRVHGRRAEGVGRRGAGSVVGLKAWVANALVAWSLSRRRRRRHLLTARELRMART